jgi:vancomycin permeability regulator SanA
MVTKNKKNKTVLRTAVIILIIILNLAFLYFIKYQNQHLSLKDFTLNNFGNGANLLLSVLLITGILITTFLQSITFDYKSFIPFFVLNQVIIISLYASSIISLPFNEIYYFGQNGNRLFTALLFTLYFFTYLVAIFIAWLNIFKIKSVIVLRSMLNSALLMLLFLIFVFLFIVQKGNGFKDLVVNDKNNIGVVLGAAVWSNNKPSPSLAGRVDKALSLLKKNKISEIYFTGSNAPGELTEAEVALNYLKSMEADTEYVHLEKKTTSTNEQVEFIRKELSSNKDNNVIVISDSYHLVRVLEICRFHNIHIQVVPSDLVQSFEQALYNNLREALALTVFWFFAI